LHCTYISCLLDILYFEYLQHSRDNLDPFKRNDDSKIWDALEKCHVKEEVEVAGGLDILVKEGGVSFSVGQRQLLCLARALLKSSKVRTITI
jgi:ATP-binding cassette subfamily C (CFTR/MRP) protein 10